MIKTPLMKAIRPRLAQPPFRGAAALILSVSGGMDSMVLLDLMQAMGHVHGAPLRVVHVDHGTGAFARCSHQLVTRYCRERELPLRVATFDWDGRGNFEYQAAGFRRQTLESERGAGEWIVLAHHLQDQSETWLQTLVRGVGGASRLGMSPNRDFRLRPFLDQDRELIVDHARRRHVPHTLDPSNFDDNLFRNALRHRVMPLLREFHGHFERRIGAWLDDQRNLNEALTEHGRQLCSQAFCNGILHRNVFAQNPDYLWDFILKEFWQAHQIPLPKHEQAHQLKIWLHTDRRAAFDHAGKQIYCDSDGIAVTPPPVRRSHPMKPDDTIAWGPWLLRLIPGKGITPAASLPSLEPVKRWNRRTREWFRRHRVPLRFRQHMPNIHFQGKEHSLVAVQCGWVWTPFSIECIQGPDFSDYEQQKQRPDTGEKKTTSSNHTHVPVE
jgi:tRNA(Ile)-lysidine synthetase-like protein